MVRPEGFTLLELLASLALAATLGGIGMARLPALLATARLAGTTHRLAATLREARGRALQRGMRIEVRFDPGRGTWEIREQGGPTMETHTLPPGVTFTALPASRRVRFTGIGTAENATVRLAAGGASRRVILNQRGRVRVQ